MARGFRFAGWDPFYDLGQLQDEMNRLFSGLMRAPAQAPPLNVYANPEDVILTAEVPGVKPENVNVQVVESTVTLTISRNAEPDHEGARYLRRERAEGTITRTLQLPFRVDAEQVAARISRGVLQVRLPRSEADKPRTISVRSE